jgi:multisubunit Na+/H+ antiporter MnhB subunit
MQILWQTWAVAGAGIIAGALLMFFGWRWFRFEEKVAGKRDPQSSVLALRSAARLIIAGILLLTLSFIYLWATDLVRTALKFSRG